MINDDFLQKQIEQARESAKILKQSQGLLDANFNKIVKSLKKEDPEKAEEIKVINDKMKSVFSKAEKGDFSQVDNLLKDLKDGFKDIR